MQADRPRGPLTPGGSADCSSLYLPVGPPSPSPLTAPPATPPPPSKKKLQWGGDFNLQLDLVVVPRGGKAETTYVASNRSYTYDVRA